MLNPKLLPTKQMYGELQDAFDFFNAELFFRILGSELPQCLITLQRKHNTMGYFSPGRHTNLQGDKVDEIAMHPGFFPLQTTSEIMQTLVHEMCHGYQHHYGNPGRARYHNKELADIARNVGLIFSDTGRPGGRPTGDSMSDYVDEEGPFEVACKKLLSTKFALSWLDRFPISIENMATTKHQLSEEVDVPMSDQDLERLEINVVDHVTRKKSTFAYTCPICAVKAWGKPNLLIGCLTCNEPMKIEGEKIE